MRHYYEHPKAIPRQRTCAVHFCPTGAIARRGELINTDVVALRKPEAAVINVIEGGV
jgi:hypothetical protein